VARELPRLERPLTDREIALREWTGADVEPLVAPLNDHEIARWTRVPAPYTRTDAEEFLMRADERHRTGEELSLAIVAADDGALLGSISVRVTSWENLRGELGYLVFSAARGRDVATRAVRLLSRFAFEGIGLQRVEILAATGNSASQRVAEKAGFTREGVLRSYMDSRGTRLDMVAFSLLPDEL
jgi:RimJ/RimL family protein N-acetyltransferase